jgi:hypothetical protein
MATISEEVTNIVSRLPLAKQQQVLDYFVTDPCYLGS